MILQDKIIKFIKERGPMETGPYYVYDKQYLREQCGKFRAIDYTPKSIHFATMANIHPEFLRLMKEERMHVFVNSILHLEAVQDAGFSSPEIIYTASALNEQTLRLIQSQSIHTNLDSPNQLRLWQQLFPNVKVGIRCNLGNAVQAFSNHAGSFIGTESRLGFMRHEIEQIEDKTIINGLHIYVGTDIFDISYFIHCYKELIELAKAFPNVEFMNFGGGFGVSEDGSKRFDFETYNKEVTTLMNAISEERGKSIQLILEPGRIIGGEAGYFVCQITDIKIRENLILAGLNASTVQFSRPLLYPDIASHPIAILRNGKQILEPGKTPTTLFGCSTYSRDLFSKKVSLPELQIGDTVVFGNAGSYSASSHSKFLGFPVPDEFFI